MGDGGIGVYWLQFLYGVMLLIVCLFVLVEGGFDFLFLYLVLVIVQLVFELFVFVIGYESYVFFVGNQLVSDGEVMQVGFVCVLFIVLGEFFFLMFDGVDVFFYLSERQWCRFRRGYGCIVCLIRFMYGVVFQDVFDVCDE